LANQAKNELQVMVLNDLAEICKTVADNSAATENLRQQAGQLAAEFNSLVPYRGKANAPVHLRAEQLLVQMFLSRIVEVESWPADSSNQ
jgi:hypothetical protein